MSENIDLTQHTFRRFLDGDASQPPLEEKIFTADYSHKCPTYVHRTPPCQGSCPSGHEIRGWLSIARGMDKPPVEDMPWQEYAFERMVEANPFPSCMGRVCPAPCEDGCNRNEVDDFVGINAVEHYVGDWAIEKGTKLPEPGEDTGKKIAVIGSGPAGLTAAYFLRRQGHAVTLFEAQQELGGMMRYGIPGYRTPRDMIDAEIDRIIAMGIEVKLETTIGQDISIADLERDYDAIFWGVGAQKGRAIPIPGWEAEACLTGVEFLDAFNHGWVFSTAKRIVIVGGGDTSIDVASVARRLGHITHSHTKDHADNVLLGHTASDVAGTIKREGVKAVLTSLFPVEGMTAAEHEREDALREGVEIKGGVMPLEVITNDEGMVQALKVCECEMEGLKPIPKEGTEYFIECDMVVSAIGQMGDLTGDLESLDNGKGFIATDAFFSMPDREKHFAGGDIIRPHLLTTAIGQGRIAAESIGHFLTDNPLSKRPKVDVHHFNLLKELNQRGLDPENYDHEQTRGTSEADYAVHNYEDRSATQIIPHDDLFKGHFPFDERRKREQVMIIGDEVLGNFDERIRNISEEQAQAEGTRCMSCGMCFECDACVIFCPQDAVFRVKKDQRAVGRYVDTDYTKCIGCHICMDVCPTGYIQMGLGE